MPVVKITRTMMAGGREELAASVGFWQQRGWRAVGPVRDGSPNARTGGAFCHDLE